MEEIREVLARVLKELKFGTEEINLEHPTEEKYGDYACNVAMVIAKKQKKNPIEVAEKIKEEILRQAQDEFLEKIQVAGSGFINFYLKKDFLTKQAEKANYEIEFRNDLARYGEGKTVVIDYSAPNIAKPFGIGHLRSTNIGQAIYNLHKILGWKCIGDNHLGDWGTQFGKLITAIKKNKTDLDELTIGDLEKLYVKFHEEAEKDPKLEDEAREWFAKLERGDEEARSLWQKCVDISLAEFDRVYQRLGVKIDVAYGESYYEKMLPEVIEEVKKRGLAKKSEGALIVELPGIPPAMIEKSNGTTTYFTRDLAAVKFRRDNWNPGRIIYEVGADQTLHFRQLFEVAKMMGWSDNCQMVHVAHGLIRWAEGKFSTRKGQTIHLEEVLKKAVEEAKKVVAEVKKGKKMGKEEKAEMIEAVAIGAVKFNDLSQDPKKDIIFDWEKVMSLQGDSGPYLQYTLARCRSVLEKTEIKEQKNIGETPREINEEEEKLLRQLARVEEKIVEAAERFSPAVLAEYLLKVARDYNEFYGKNRIINQPEEVWRVFLTRTTMSVLETGLMILGIKVVERM